MADRQISLTIGVNDDGTPVIKAFQANAEEAFRKVERSTGGLVDSIKKHWLGLTAAAAAAGLAINRAWALADAAAQYQEQRESLNALATQYGTSAGQIISSIQTVSRGLVSMSDAVNIAGSAMAKGLSPEQIVNLAGAAETLSNVTGQKVSDAFRNMADSIALGRSRGIEAAVGMIDLKDRYGDLVEKMSEAEKAQKMYAIVMERVNGIQKTLGEGTDSVGDKMERFQARLSDIEILVGEGVIRAFAGLVSVVEFMGAMVNGAIGSIAFGLQKLFELMAKIPGVGKFFEGLGILAKEVADNSLQASKTGLQDAINNFQIMAKLGDEAEKKADGKGGPPPSGGGGTPGEAIKKTSLKEVTEKEMDTRIRIRSWVEEYGQKDTQKDGTALYIEDVRLREQSITQIMQEAEASRAAMMEHEAWVAEKTAAQMLVAAKTHEWAEQSRARIVSTAYKAVENQMLRLIETGKFSVGAMAKVIAAQVKMELVGIAARAAVYAIFYTGLGLAAAASGNAASASSYFAAAGQMASVGAGALAAAAGVQAMTGGSTGQTSGGSMAAIGGGGPREDNQYRYYGYESSQYGSGWRPGEGQGPGKSEGTTIIVQGDVYAQDGDAFRKKVVNAWADDYKDNGKTRDVSRRYA